MTLFFPMGLNPHVIPGILVSRFAGEEFEAGFCGKPLKIFKNYVVLYFNVHLSSFKRTILGSKLVSKCSTTVDG